ncbi:hypothetical protein DVH05_009587 [Phytophthora capsici]|nr:hypothetical protein DVH05_009587 [Phytophthora capsici]
MKLKNLLDRQWSDNGLIAIVVKEEGSVERWKQSLGAVWWMAELKPVPTSAGWTSQTGVVVLSAFPWTTSACPGQALLHGDFGTSRTGYDRISGFLISRLPVIQVESPFVFPLLLPLAR